jgi:hypothetical protein
MPQRNDYEFSRLVGALCIRAHTNVVKLGKKLGIDPAELFQVINGYHPKL